MILPSKLSYDGAGNLAHGKKLYVLCRGVSDVCCHHSLLGQFRPPFAGSANCFIGALAVAPTITRLKPVEQSRVFASPPSRPDAKVPRAARSFSTGAWDRRFGYAASS